MGSGRRMNDEASADFTVVDALEVRDFYEGTNVPGEFRSLTEALGATQLAATLIRIPPHSDFEQGTGHYHEEVEELYLVGRGTLTMRFGDEIRSVGAGSIVRVAPSTPRSHRNEGEEPVELWAVLAAHRGRRCHQDRRFLEGLAERAPGAPLSRLSSCGARAAAATATAARGGPGRRRPHDRRPRVADRLGGARIVLLATNPHSRSQLQRIVSPSAQKRGRWPSSVQASGIGLQPRRRPAHEREA